VTSPRVSVVMPAYQAAETIGAAVASVLWQDYPSYELIVVDDGSTDATRAIAEAHGSEVRVSTQDNRGVAAARNAGIRSARGDLITFCDADDMLFEHHLTALVDTHERGRGGIATANSYWLLPGGIHKSKQRYKGKFPAADRQRLAILEQNFVSTMSLFPRTLFEEIGPFDEARRRAEDWDFWLRAIFNGYRVDLQPEPLSLYRWTTTSLSADWEEMDADVEGIFGEIEQRVELAPDEREYVRRRRATPGPRRLARQGDEALEAARYSEAARAYREAAALCQSERMLVWKARLLTPAPRLAGPFVRARQKRIKRRLGVEAGHTR
jgi:glycosyltransferase involved in cell wall biosynthesis